MIEFVAYIALFQISVKGWLEETTQPMVDGIVRAIVQAHNNMRRGTLTTNVGELLDANINRSPKAYLLNPEQERAQYNHNVDKDMTLLGFHDDDDGSNSPMGFINWYDHTMSCIIDSSMNHLSHCLWIGLPFMAHQSMQATNW